MSDGLQALLINGLIYVIIAAKRLVNGLSKTHFFAMFYTKSLEFTQILGLCQKSLLPRETISSGTGISSIYYKYAPDSRRVCRNSHGCTSPDFTTKAAAIPAACPVMQHPGMTWIDASVWRSVPMQRPAVRTLSNDTGMSERKGSP